MKIRIKLFLSAIICLTIISSCKKEIDYHPEWDLATMSAKTDGTLVTCSMATAQFFPVNGKNTLQIIGSKGEMAFSLMINEFKGTGTYNLSDNNLGIYAESLNGIKNAYLSSANGSIKITTYTPDKIIKGTFEFQGANILTSATKKITEGQFSISLVPVKVPAVTPGNTNLNANVDGAAASFTGEAISISSPIGNLLSVIAVNGDKRLTLSLIGYKGIGTYDIAKDGEASYSKDQSATGSFYAETGTLVITSESGGRLKGTFSFKGPNQNATVGTSVNVTNGTFDVPLSKK
ncbi:DUF6252 family protein [Pedobacter sandarakinus]|uniref:DUF6252 family protein n=1 Tax=Pedobacter sandarakinus TaxID=353156 RepID=UPI0022459166|nr:DUF6252 family protein [Pedobacter sandarakinus]MCX2575506.1 DUF6252 family protein [Pedobacter sandarakinus]